MSYIIFQDGSGSQYPIGQPFHSLVDSQMSDCDLLLRKLIYLHAIGVFRDGFKKVVIYY